MKVEANGEFRSSDKFLSELRESLAKRLLKAQDGLINDELKLHRASVEKLARDIVDFAEDIGVGVGLWTTYERVNRRLFGTPLPLIVSPDNASEGEPGLYLRLRHLLYVLYPRFVPDVIVPPENSDLACLAHGIADFLSKYAGRFPADSRAKALLDGPNQRGWEVKRKLVWLGTRSYLFQHFYEEYVVAMNDGKSLDLIGITDDFVCQEHTAWSGLSAVDLLADVLDVAEDRREEVRSWERRHAAPYRVVSASSDALTLLNLVNDASYKVRIDADPAPFVKGIVVIGALAPWNGEWYWSGKQQLFEEGAVDSGKLKQLYLEKSPKIVYRYCPDRLEKARSAIRRHHQEFLELHGSDFVIYSDGFKMAADWQAQARRKFECLTVEEQQRFLRKHGLASYKPPINVPRDLLERRDGICVFSNPDFGQEVMQGFQSVRTGLEKKGKNLTADEQDYLRGWFESPSISPEFIKRFVGEYGAQSILAAYCLSKNPEAYVLD